MKNVRVRLKGPAVSGLQIAYFLWFVIKSVGRKMFVDKKIPHLFVALAGIESLILGVTDPAEFFIRNRWLRAVAMAYQLNDSIAVINLLPQHCAQISAFGAKNLLPHRLIAEKR